jgi:hypothetical protein
MGIDWFRMRLQPGVDRGAVAECAAYQAYAFQHMPSWWNSDLLPGVEIPKDPELLEVYRRSSDELFGLLDIVDAAEGNTSVFPSSFRVYPITKNTIFRLKRAWRPTVRSFVTSFPRRCPRGDSGSPW